MGRYEVDARAGVTPGLVSAVVVNWNGARLLNGWLDALLGQSYSPIEVIVVDNGSTDGSPALLAERGVTPIENRGNSGFAAANNVGIAASRGEFVLLLNTDVVLAPDYVAVLVAALRAEPARGSATGKLVRGRDDPSDPPIVDSAGHVMSRCVWAVNRGQEDPDGPPFAQSGEVFGVCAAAALYRREMLADVAIDGEVLDADFFAYLEDVDLDWRAQIRGWRSWYEPRATAVHLRSASGVRASARTQRHILKNRLLMILKNDTGPGLYRRLPAILAFTAAKVGQLLVTRPTALLGLWDFGCLAPRALRKRHRIQERRIVPAGDLETWFLPLRGVRRAGLRSAAS